MSFTFVGFFRAHAANDGMKVFRDTGAPPAPLAKKVNEFPSSLPATCKLIGTWNVSGGDRRSVTIVEVESYADLQFIDTYYAGWLEFEWHPTAQPRRDW